MHYTCPVCGFPDLDDPPRTENSGGSYEICPSCGFQFGVSDDDLGITYEEWRKRSIALGRLWNSIGIEPPGGWDPEEQLRKHLEIGK